MNKRMAHAFLNAAKAGYPATQADILRALRVTGDMDGAKRHKPPVMENVMHLEVQGQRQPAEVVEAWE